MKTIKTISIFMVLAALLCSCVNNQRDTRQIVRKVKIETVKLADTMQIKTFPGRVREAGEINLAFRVAGPIRQIMVREGDYVRAGQMIAQMDTRDYEKQLQAAQAQYDQVKAEADRVIELHSRQSIASSEYDKAVTGLRLVETQLKHARDQLNDTRLLAPVSGYIQKLNFRNNELIDAGIPLATLIDVSRYQIEADIPASLLIGREDILSIQGILSAGGDGPFGLDMISISPKAAHNQLFRLQMAPVQSKMSGLVPGLDIQINIALRQNGDPQVCVPLSAVFRQQAQDFVWVYDLGSKLVSSREVVPGKLTGDGRIRIITGLQPGEQIVVAGVSLISNNEKVEPMEPVSDSNVGGLL
jgi:RND family efflux transporter MFP subunit